MTIFDSDVGFETSKENYFVKDDLLFRRNLKFQKNKSLKISVESISQLTFCKTCFASAITCFIWNTCIHSKNCL